MKRLALISTSKKTPELQQFAHELESRGLQILSSGGTHKFLWESPVVTDPVDIATIVGEPILGHRVVTLDRRVFAAVLATESDGDTAELERIGIGRIEIVYIGLYPLEQLVEEELAKSEPDWNKLRENIDIGGPSFLRAAGKGDRLVIYSEQQFDKVLRILDGEITGTDLVHARLCMAAAAEEAVQRHSSAASSVYSAMARMLIKS